HARPVTPAAQVGLEDVGGLVRRGSHEGDASRPQLGPEARVRADAHGISSVRHDNNTLSPNRSRRSPVRADWYGSSRATPTRPDHVSRASLPALTLVGT